MNLKTDIVEPAVSSDISDERCVERIKSGETELFEVLIRRHQKKIFNLVYRMIGDYDDAGDAGTIDDCSNRRENSCAGR